MRQIQGPKSSKPATDDPSQKVERRFFRFRVPPSQSNAVVRVGGFKIPVELQESSIDGFAVLVEKNHAAKIRLGQRWILNCKNERTEVFPQWIYCAIDGRLQVGMRRLEDLTPIPKSRFWPRIGRPGYREFDHTLVFAAMTILLFLALALPGLGDLLGTAPWIENTLRELLGGAIRR